jgi:hypothetical protein
MLFEPTREKTPLALHENILRIAAVLTRMTQRGGYLLSKGEAEDPGMNRTFGTWIEMLLR